MRSFLCKTAVFSAALALVFFCSCERHKPDELHHAGGHGTGDAAGHEDAAGESGKHADDHQHSADQHRATTAMSVTPPPASPTPANFFPTASPH